ncbi:O-antigen ligase domain-containing protein [Streptomyces sp. 8K308]|uniref:O-antigen ligase family protein n=1 Tax=Streptomyces sp. 8K308 TaxID=2530388 RepID=UPI00104FD9E9|nr:O-antigen ligase family protein [Streptomyces sp. 8K308]TDC24899.1 O-antigen ligase domain-containing protein [Streptomyces sp. 8K308]
MRHRVMRNLSRDAALPLVGAVTGLLLLMYGLVAHSDLVAGLLASPESEAAQAGGDAGWQVALLVGAVAVVAALLPPPGVLLAAAVVMVHGLGSAALTAPVMGPLLASDLLLLVYLVRVPAPPRQEGRGAARRLVGPSLALFLGWSVLATAIAGASVTPLLRIAVYAAVFLALSRRGTSERRVVYGVVLCYALVNLAGGVLQGQTRLVGLDIGDPAQTGALLLAALCPLLSGELRFTGRWVVAAALLGGIFLTQTRGVWFAAAVMLLVWRMPRLSPVQLVTLLLGMAVLGFKIVDSVSQRFGLNGDSVGYRVHSIVNGIRDGLANPVFGSGWGEISSMEYLRQHLSDLPEEVRPYNLFVSVFTFTGVPGLLLLTLFLAALLGPLLAARRGAPLLFTVAVLTMSLSEMTFFAGSMLTLLFFVYAGLGLGREDAPPSGDGSVKKENPPPPRRGSAPPGHVAGASP